MPFIIHRVHTAVFLFFWNRYLGNYSHHILIFFAYSLALHYNISAATLVFT